MPTVLTKPVSDVNVPATVTLAELSPLIQATEPSTPSAIINCLSPVALSALILPMITLPSPLVILSPESLPKLILEAPVVIAFKALEPIAVLLLNELPSTPSKASAPKAVLSLPVTL